MNPASDSRVVDADSDQCRDRSTCPGGTCLRIPRHATRIISLGHHRTEHVEMTEHACNTKTGRRQHRRRRHANASTSSGMLPRGHLPTQPSDWPRTPLYRIVTKQTRGDTRFYAPPNPSLIRAAFKTSLGTPRQNSTPVKIPPTRSQPTREGST